MAFATYELAPQWSAAARFAADGGTVSLRVVNPATSLSAIHYVPTSDDAIPGLPPGLAGVLKPGDSLDVTLLDGERLWLASSAKAGGHATVLY